jgi:peroxiredoxin
MRVVAVAWLGVLAWGTWHRGPVSSPRHASAAPLPQESTPPAAAPGADAPANPAATPAADPVLGRRIPQVIVRDTAGAEVGLYDFRDARLLVVCVLNTGCPVGNKFIPVLNELQTRYRERGVQFLAVNPQGGDSAEEIARHAREYALQFPVWCDAEQVLTDVLGATRTCETFVLDPQRTVRYHGRIDDRFQPGADRPEPTRHDLATALDELLDGQPVSVATTPVAGCKLTRTRRAPARGEITWSGQIASLVHTKCSNCHHPETAAPFSLMTYEQTADWAAMIREVVQQRRMPPWHADPRFGDFSDERRLTQAELDLLLAWLDDGLPRGEPTQDPAPPTYPDGWRIGKPDVVFEIPEEVTIPAQGLVPYLYFETPTGFTEDVWVEAAEARPGNRQAVHHIILYYRLPNEKGRRGFRENWVDGAAPGNTPLIFPAGVGRKIPAGATLVWEMHYTATGKEEKDRSQYAFRLHKQKPEREAKMIPITNSKFRIPAGDPNHRVVSSFKLPFAADVLAFAPHMHLRGKDFEYRARFPDGRTEILMSMPQYDFNWQSGYALRKAQPLPVGTVIECTAHFDNSAGNPHNPNPKSEVRWGDQTWQEMMIGFIDLVPAQ